MSAVLDLRIIHADVERRTNMALYPVGLTLPQYTVLKVLEDGTEKSMRDVAREVGMTAQTIHSVTGNLVGERLVTRIVRPHGGRRIPMVISDRGREVLAEADKVVAAMDAYLVGLIGHRAADTLATAAEMTVEPTH